MSLYTGLILLKPVTSSRTVGDFVTLPDNDCVRCLLSPAGASFTMLRPPYAQVNKFSLLGAVPQSRGVESPHESACVYEWVCPSRYAISSERHRNVT